MAKADTLCGPLTIGRQCDSPSFQRCSAASHAYMAMILNRAISFNTVGQGHKSKLVQDENHGLMQVQNMFAEDQIGGLCTSMFGQMLSLSFEGDCHVSHHYNPTNRHYCGWAKSYTHETLGFRNRPHSSHVLPSARSSLWAAAVEPKEMRPGLSAAQGPSRGASGVVSDRFESIRFGGCRR